MKTAVIISGGGYNCRYSIQSIMDRLVLPNDADVFILLTRQNRRRKAPFTKERISSATIEKWVEKVKTQIADETPLTDDELDLIRNVFGHRLKVLSLVEDSPDYQHRLQVCRDRMMHVVNGFRHESKRLGVPQPFGGDIRDTDNGNVRIVVDQYCHVAECYRLMVEFEKTGSGRYESVIRIRPDFIPSRIFVLEDHYREHGYPDKLFVCGSSRQEIFEWLDEFCFFGQRSVCDKVFPQLNQMGALRNRKYSTVYKDNEYMFAPETQFSILLHEIGVPIHGLPFYRSSCYSDGGDGWDYLNYFLLLPEAVA